MEVTFKSTNETGTMFVSNREGDFLDGHLCLKQKANRRLHSSTNNQLPEASPGLPLEHVLNIGVAQIEASGQIIDCARRFRRNDLQDYSYTVVGRRNWQRVACTRLFSRVLAKVSTGQYALPWLSFCASGPCRMRIRSRI